MRVLCVLNTALICFWNLLSRFSNAVAADRLAAAAHGVYDLKWKRVVQGRVAAATG
jgi:hypothetical protein